MKISINPTLENCLHVNHEFVRLHYVTIDARNARFLYKSESVLERRILFNGLPRFEYARYVCSTLYTKKIERKSFPTVHAPSVSSAPHRNSVASTDVFSIHFRFREAQKNRRKSLELCAPLGQEMDSYVDIGFIPPEESFDDSVAMAGDEYVRCNRCGFGGCDVRVSSCGCTLHAVRSFCTVVYV